MAAAPPLPSYREVVDSVWVSVLRWAPALSSAVAEIDRLNPSDSVSPNGTAVREQDARGAVLERGIVGAEDHGTRRR